MGTQRAAQVKRAASSGGTAVRVSPATYSVLKELASESGQPLARCLEELVQDAYRQRLWQRYAEANRRLRADPQALAAQRAETAIWSAADADGLDPDDGVPAEEALEDAASW